MNIMPASEQAFEERKLLNEIARLNDTIRQLNARLKNSQRLANAAMDSRADIIQQMYGYHLTVDASGKMIELPDPAKKIFSPDSFPVTLWFRMVPDDDKVLQPDYSHFEEGHVDTDVPSPKGTTKFTGIWTKRFAQRTDAICPKIF